MIVPEKHPNPVLKFIAFVIGAEVLIFAGVAVFYALSNSLNLVNYATGLFIAGAIVMGFGAVGVMGNNRFAGDLTARYIETVSDEDMKSRQRRIQRDGESARINAAKLTIIGLIPLIASIALSFAAIDFV